MCACVVLGGIALEVLFIFLFFKENQDIVLKNELPLFNTVFKL